MEKSTTLMLPERSRDQPQRQRRRPETYAYGLSVLRLFKRWAGRALL